MDPLDQRLTDAGAAWRQAQAEPPQIDRLVVGLERHPRRLFAPRAALLFAAGLVIVAALAAVPVGARNNSLNRTAFRLFQLVAGGELDRDHVIAELVAASHRNGLVRNDGLRAVLATIQSAERGGMQFPRSRGAA